MDRGTSIKAVFRASLTQAEEVIARFRIDATARQVGALVIVEGPSIDLLGRHGIEALARDRQLPLVAIR